MARPDRPRDIVLLHDPQTAGMVDGLRTSRRAGRLALSRRARHAQRRDRRGMGVPAAISSNGADAFVFSRHEYVPEWVARDRLVVIPPSIDPFSAKNRELDRQPSARSSAPPGSSPARDWRRHPLRTPRRLRGTVRHHTDLIADGPPPPHDARLIVQVSRWDRLKDMAGVLTRFVKMAALGPTDAHLMLVGPDVTGVTDDPEGADVFAECRALWATVPSAVRQRVHLASIPMDDVDENAIIINALQRHAYLIVQKSLVEGFGLTVTEAMWKAKPVIASRVGGIQDQIVDECDGLLISDPYDLDALAASMARLLYDPELADRLGAAGRTASTTSSSAIATSPSTSSSSQASARPSRSERSSPGGQAPGGVDACRAEPRARV